MSSVSSATMEDFIKTYATTTSQKQAEEKRTSDKDMFLNLLVTQMQYQDPLDPQDNSEYLSQMAQFTTLEIMENMSTTTKMTEANSLIGKAVTATNTDGRLIAGTVDGVSIKSGEVYLRIDDQDVALDKVQAVTSFDAGESTNYTKLTYANSLVGKVVSGIKVQGDNKTEFAALVQSSDIVDGEVVLRACSIDDGKDIDIKLSEINSVTEMVPASEEILEYVKQLYEIITATNKISDETENAVNDITE